MNEGTVCMVDVPRGFGFIRRPGESDLFFHATGTAPDLEFTEQLRERRVQFDVEQTDRGPKAVNVRAAD